MITSLFGTNKVTANQHAKQMILDALDSKGCAFDTEGMTEKETDALREAFDNQCKRVEKLMGGIQKVYNF